MIKYIINCHKLFKTIVICRLYKKAQLTPCMQRTGDGAIRSADPENTSQPQNQICSGPSGSDAPFAIYSPLNYTVTLKLGFRVTRVYRKLRHWIGRPKNPIEPNITPIGKLVAKLWPFLYTQDAVSRHLEFYRAANIAVRSTDPANPSLEPNTEWIDAAFARQAYLPLNYTAGAQRRGWISVFIPPKSAQVYFLWGENDVRTAIQQLYRPTPKKTYTPKTNFWLRPCYTMTLKLGLWVTQSHRKQHNSIENIYDVCSSSIQ